MNTFGFKAFFRALAISVSIYLVKIGIEVVRQADGTFLKIGYAVVIIAAIFLLMILPNILFPTKHEPPSKDRNPNNEKVDG